MDEKWGSFLGDIHLLHDVDSTFFPLLLLLLFYKFKGVETSRQSPLDICVLLTCGAQVPED